MSVVLLSHNGADTDIKLASRVSGLDAILGGHTHDAIPSALEVKNSKGITLVTNAGSNGKFLGALDFDVRGGRIKNWSYKLLPVFSDLLNPDPDMSSLISDIRAPLCQAVERSFSDNRRSFISARATLTAVLISSSVTHYEMSSMLKSRSPRAFAGEQHCCQRQISPWKTLWRRWQLLILQSRSMK
jgi:2',3'-cyclic-nucleotide 2'-phosphodiesterase (5'-nucleotidase family)